MDKCLYYSHAHTRTHKYTRTHTYRHTHIHTHIYIYIYGHLPSITKTIQVRQTWYAGHCWRSRDELVRDVLLWTPHMAEQNQDDQLEHTYSSYVRIRDVALNTCQRRWTIYIFINIKTCRHHEFLRFSLLICLYWPLNKWLTVLKFEQILIWISIFTHGNYFKLIEEHHHHHHHHQIELIARNPLTLSVSPCLSLSLSTPISISQH